MKGSVSYGQMHAAVADVHGFHRRWRPRSMSFRGWIFFLAIVAPLCNGGQIMPVRLDFSENGNARPGIGIISDPPAVAVAIPRDGSEIEVSFHPVGGNLTSSDRGLGVTGGINNQLNPGQSVELSFSRPVRVTGYTLAPAQFSATPTEHDDSLHQTTQAPAVVTQMNPVRGLDLIVLPGETFSLGTASASTGIRLESVDVDVFGDDNPDTAYFQVLGGAYHYRLDVLEHRGRSQDQIQSVTSADLGTVSVADGFLTYALDPGSFGRDEFRYSAETPEGDVYSQGVIIDIRRTPNFVYILADDLGWSGTSVAMDSSLDSVPGAAARSFFIETPAMENLAAQGMRFSRAYSMPNCSPTRYSLLTGKSSARHQLTEVLGRTGGPNSPRGGSNLLDRVMGVVKGTIALTPEEVTLPAFLKEIDGADYTTAHFGKFHLTHDWHPPFPVSVTQALGFDAGDGPLANSVGDENPVGDPKHAFGLTKRSLDFIEDALLENRPFYCQVWHFAPHTPVIYLPATLEKYAEMDPSGDPHIPEESTPERFRQYAAMTTDFDTSVGILMTRLRQLGIEHNTYLILGSDNGPDPGWINTLPLRGAKTEVWEGGVRVPKIIRGPGIAPDTQLDVPVVCYDMFPTIVEWAVQNLPEPGPPLPTDIDGGSIIGSMNDRTAGKPDVRPVPRPARDIYINFPHFLRWPQREWSIPSAAIISDTHKLVAWYNTGELLLYDLRHDIGESLDLSQSDLENFYQLRVRLRDYFREVGAQFPRLNPDFIHHFGAGNDLNNNNLPDHLELSELLTSVEDPDVDLSGNGSSISEDIAAGRDPLHPDLKLHFGWIGFEKDGSDFVDSLQLSWATVPGQTYQIETSADLEHWSTAVIIDQPNGRLYSGSAFSLSANVRPPNGETRRVFYRVKRVLFPDFHK